MSKPKGFRWFSTDGGTSWELRATKLAAPQHRVRLGFWAKLSVEPRRGFPWWVWTPAAGHVAQSRDLDAAKHAAEAFLFG